LDGSEQVVGAKGEGSLWMFEGHGNVHNTSQEQHVFAVLGCGKVMKGPNSAVTSG
jgi:hypothetical protein